MRNTKEQLALEMLRQGEQVDVGGIPMVVTYVGQHAGEPVALATEDGLGVEWDLSCPGEDLGSDDEVLCADLLSGEHYGICVYCRGVTSTSARPDARQLPPRSLSRSGWMSSIEPPLPCEAIGQGKPTL